MSIAVHYSPKRFTKATAWTTNNQKIDVERQTVWRQIEDDLFLEVEIQRPAAGFNRAAFVNSAMMRRGQKLDGFWESAAPFQQQQIELVEDDNAPATTAPKAPKAPSNAGSKYITQAYGGRTT